MCGSSILLPVRSMSKKEKREEKKKKKFFLFTSKGSRILIRDVEVSVCPCRCHVCLVPFPSRGVTEGWDASLKTSSYLENGKKGKRNVRQTLGKYQLFILLLGKSFSRNYLVGKKTFFYSPTRVRSCEENELIGSNNSDSYFLGNARTYTCCYKAIGRVSLLNCRLQQQ